MTLSSLHLASPAESAATSSTFEASAVKRVDCSDQMPLPMPSALVQAFPVGERARNHITKVRARIHRRLVTGRGAPVAIVGPCSIHCETAALEYAERLLQLQRRLGERIQLVMRVYLEKPRTSVGWKGFLYDPELDGSDDLIAGLTRGRRLMAQIANMGVAIATEILDPMLAPFLGDCLSWVAVGARTSESQIHRQMASRLSCPVGFKNATDGSIQSAIDACEAAKRPHVHLGIDESGRAATMRSPGNASTHLVLRGGARGPNFGAEFVREASTRLEARNHHGRVLVDCSHGNSQKDYRRQPEVAREVIARMCRSQRESELLGLMLESHLVPGKQTLDTESPDAAKDLRYGMSVTDGCIDFATTEGLLSELSRAASRA